MKKIIVGVFPNRFKIEEIIKELQATGVSNSEISCIYSDKSGHIKDGQSNQKMEDGVAKGAAAGAVIGALAGLVVANGIIPGLGTLFVAGPLVEVFGLGITGAMATTAVGVATGALAVGVASALMELGISNEDAMIYEEYIKGGEVVLIVHTASKAIKDILVNNKATRVGEYHGI